MNRLTSLILLCLLLLAPLISGADPLVSADKLKGYVERFNADDREVYPTTITNVQTLDFLQARLIKQ